LRVLVLNRELIVSCYYEF